MIALIASFQVITIASFFLNLRKNSRGTKNQSLNHILMKVIALNKSYPSYFKKKYTFTNVLK